MSNNIHPSFKHGKNFKIGDFCIIHEDVEVGDDVTIENYVLLKKGTKIGSRVFVDSYVRSSGDNDIGDDVTLRFGSTIARKIHIGNKVFIAPNVMTIFSKHTGEKSSGTWIGDGSFIGTAAVLNPNISIAAGTTIGAMSLVTKSIADPGIYCGVPAKKIK